jgi:prolyl oligopeptidase
VKTKLQTLGVAVLLLAFLAGAAPANQSAQRTIAGAPATGPNGTDPFLWLENKDGARAMAWVRAQNARSLPVLERDPHYAKLYAEALKIDQSQSRIPYPEYLGGQVYNFWQDAKHVRGIWRRTSLQSYRSASPAWTTVLDLDALAKREHANWVWKGADCQEPQERRCMISLSDGGEDAVTEREFDLGTRSFVAGGFVLPREKQSSTWVDANTLLVSRAWEPGQLTKSGYSYVIKLVRRGQPLSNAAEVYRGTPADVSVDTFALHDGSGHQAVLVRRGVTFFTNEYYLFNGERVQKIDLPQKADVSGLVNGALLVSLNQDWQAGGKAFKQGSVVSVDLASVQAPPAKIDPAVVYVPGPRESVDAVSATKNDVVLTVYQNVRGRAFVFTPNGARGWTKHQLALPDNSTVSVVDTNLHDNRIFLTASGFLSPTTLYTSVGADGSPQELKALAAEFDASNDVVEQHEATSKDGTKIPYFIVRPKAMRFDGANPTVLYAYGGFQLSMTPSYSGTIGKLWLERGGVYVLANIRGGGEFGPAWHDAGLKTHRQRIYDDFYAVGKDLIARKVTDPRHLGIMGGSNGGLLMGVEFTEHPEMWNAVQIEVPLLDMLRFEKIQAGASWVGEYGSVSVPAERAFLAKISPYQNLKAGVAYPEPFIWTTTKDDRVGPQHARKFAAKLASMHVPYLYYEVTEGGHGSGANLKETAKTQALGWTYFTMKLME